MVMHVSWRPTLMTFVNSCPFFGNACAASLELKTTPHCGTIRVEAKPLGQVLEVVVRDTGEGIPDSELPHIFEPLYQGKGREKMEKSTGLGLSIVKEIVAIHQGDINVESENGKGTIFYVRLPSTKSVLASAA